MKSRPSSPHSQQGVALVTAILMVAIATSLAAKMMWDNQLNLRRTESNMNIETAKQIALSAEAAALTVVEDLGAENGNSQEEIATFNREFFGVFTLPEGDEEIEIGQFYGSATPANSRLNVNDLVVGGAPDADMRLRFQRLFSDLNGGEADIPLELIDSIIDWIDPDTIPQGAGAEDDSYTALDPAYRTSGNYLTDISELRSVGGVTREVYEVLLPHVTAIPAGWCNNTSGRTPVNLNFASAQVIAALTDDPAFGQTLADYVVDVPLSNKDLESELNSLGLGVPYEDVGPFVNAETVCFELRVFVTVGSSSLTMYSLIDRSAGGRPVARVRAYGLEN